jgi:hypothetical protein
MADQAAAAEAHPKTKIILDYIAQHAFTEKLNTLVNKLCTVRPADPWDFLVCVNCEHVCYVELGCYRRTIVYCITPLTSVLFMLFHSLTSRVYFTTHTVVHSCACPLSTHNSPVVYTGGRSQEVGHAASGGEIGCP